MSQHVDVNERTQKLRAALLRSKSPHLETLDEPAVSEPEPVPPQIAQPQVETTLAALSQVKVPIANDSLTGYSPASSARVQEPAISPRSNGTRLPAREAITPFRPPAQEAKLRPDDNGAAPSPNRTRAILGAGAGVLIIGVAVLLLRPHGAPAKSVQPVAVVSPETTILPLRTTSVILPGPIVNFANTPVAQPQPASQAPNRPVVRAFTPPQLEAGTTNAPGAVVLDPLPPALQGGAPTPSVSNAPVALDRVSAPPAKQQPQVPVANRPEPPRLLKKVAPTYPTAAKSAHVQGTVKFSALIGKDGKIKKLQPVDGHPLLIRAATDAVTQWLYQPGLINGEPVEVTTDIAVVFDLK